MPLGFLNPWFWLGALAVAAPVYLHLRRKRESNLVRFSAVRFLQDQSAARRSPWSVRDAFLLLVRALAVVLIVAAFTWPYWRGSRDSRVTESVVYILDNTLSRQADNGFVADRDRIARELQSAPAGVQAAVVELAAAPRVVVAFGDDRLEARRKVKALQPSFEHGSYLAAFRRANSLLGEVPSKRKRIVLLGDNQAGQWDENVSTPPFLRDVALELPKRSLQQLPNLWLADPRAQRVFLGQSSKVNLTFRLGHLGPARSARVHLVVNGRPILDRDVDLLNQPQNIAIQAQCEAQPSEWLRIEAHVAGSPDSLEADNHLYYSVPSVTEGKVALLAESPYLQVALSPEVMRGQWRTRILNQSGLQAELQRGGDSDVLCLESSFLQSEDARALLRQYLSARRGVLLVVNRLTPAIDGFLRDLGFQPDGMRVPVEPQTGTFRFVSASRSIFQPFESPDFGNLTDVTISRYAALRATGGRPLIISASGDGLFFEGTKFSGKLFVCAFGLDREHTSWPVHPTFLPFLDLALQGARPVDEARSNFEPGELAVVEMAPGVSARELVLRQSDLEVERVPVQGGRARLRLPAKPGLYSAHLDGNVAQDRIFSVNVPAIESELLFVDSRKSILDGWTLHGRHSPAESRPLSPEGVGFSAILRQQFWWWMILGGLLALALEAALVELKGEKT